MDLSQGSSPQMKDFIDLMNHPHDEDEDQTGHGGTGNGIPKKEEILPSYDFQPLRPIAGLAATSSPSPNFDSAPAIGGSARPWSSGDSKPKTGSPIRNYASLDSVDPAKFILEKDQSSFDSSTIMAEIDKTMKKHTDNLLYVLDGVSARLTQLETRTRNLENSVDDLKISVGNNHGSTDGKMRQLENILREVQSGVQVLKDKQEIVEAQLHLAKLQLSNVDQHTETQNTVHVDPVQPAASAPQQSQPQLPVPASIPPPHPSFSSPNTPQQLQQQLPPPVNIPPPHPSYSSPNAPPQPAPQQNLPPPVQHPNQFPQNQITSVPQRDPYLPTPGQTQEPPSQQYPSQQQLPPSAIPPPQQYQPPPQPQFSQPPPQQHPSLAPVNPSQLQPSLSHHSEEPPYVPSQSYPPNLRQPPSQPPSGPPPSQQFYGAPPPHVYEPPPSSRPISGFSSGYCPPSGLSEQFSYGGSPSQYGNTSGIKPHSPTAAQGGGSGYPQMPTARVLPRVLPAASAVGAGSGSSGTGNRVPIDDVIDKVTTMGFPRDHVRATVRKLTENGQSVDLNVVLDKLMNEGEGQIPRGWFGR